MYKLNSLRQSGALWVKGTRLHRPKHRCGKCPFKTVECPHKLPPVYATTTITTTINTILSTSTIQKSQQRSCIEKLLSTLLLFVVAYPICSRIMFQGQAGYRHLKGIPYKGEHRWTFRAPPKLFFQQEQDEALLRIKGDVTIKSYDPRVGTDEGVIIDLDMIMSHEDVQSMIEIQVHNEGVILRTKPHRSRSTITSLTVAATISIPLSNPYIQTVGVYTGRLGITVDPSTDLVAELLELKTAVGFVSLDRAYGVEASKLKVSVASGPITGDIGLFKSVNLHATSGAITSTVFPQDYTDDLAIFKATANSGEIAITFHDENIPRRTYETEIRTTAGRIRGQYLLGHALSLKSTSGNIYSTIIPTGAPNAKLYTSAVMGNAEIKFKGELGAGKLGLFAKHESTSGSINVKYPRDFEGALKAHTVAGRIGMGGEGVTIVSAGSPGNKTVRGAKGVGAHGRGGTLEADGTSGGMQLWVG
ncbi:hypothetical protein L873DRAFT_1747873 [Choiromyces venosus 120613-1]|uniref:Uncharacterized protein n=1 Tax=Choiromyces venosus 120613-1 TaxID=1336337 RepID=A0A3N4JB62_9PEZI|nr:hypothetical protein L873DRAFT_1747873 [Choiromyces venosus 120613-1]